MKFKPRQLVIMAFMTAMSIILRRILTVHIPVGIINFSGFPIILAGFLFGPVSGGIVGAVSDLLGFPLFPTGAYSPAFTLTSALTGMIPAFVVMRLKRKESAPLWLIIISIVIGELITNVLMVPYFLQILFGVPFLWKSPVNLVVMMIHAPMYGLLAKPVLAIYNNLYPREAMMTSGTSR